MDDWAIPIVGFITWSYFVGLTVHILTWEYMQKKVLEERSKSSKLFQQLSIERMDGHH